MGWGFGCEDSSGERAGKTKGGLGNGADMVRLRECLPGECVGGPIYWAKAEAEYGCGGREIEVIIIVCRVKSILEVNNPTRPDTGTPRPQRLPDRGREVDGKPEIAWRSSKPQDSH